MLGFDGRVEGRLEPTPSSLILCQNLSQKKPIGSQIITSENVQSKQVIAGVDGCKAGWIAIKQISGTGFCEPVLFSSFKSLCLGLNDCQVIAIDMPVVLSDEASRECDVQARKLLAKRASTIFSAPSKQILYAESYEEANTLNKKLFNKGISKQAWYLFPKIREVSEFLAMNPDWSKRIFECHPELSFRAMNQSEVLLNSKKSEVGIEKRIKLIEEAFKVKLDKKIFNTFLKREVTIDDYLDAFSCLWTAGRILKGKHVVLGNDVKDSIKTNALAKMQIVF